MARVHPGFAKVAAGISQREHVPAAQADAILASASRHASPAAKARNPRLNRVAQPRPGAAEPDADDMPDPRHTTPHPSMPGRSVSGRMMPSNTTSGLPREPQYVAAPVPKMPKGY